MKGKFTMVEDNKTEQIKIKVNSKMFYKLKCICDRNDKVLEEQLECIIEKFIYDYELHNGVISLLNYRIHQPE